MCSTLQIRTFEHAALEIGEIMTALLQQRRRVLAGGHAGCGGDTGAGDLVISTVFNEITKQRLGHRAAAGVASADKENTFQDVVRV